MITLKEHHIQKAAELQVLNSNALLLPVASLQAEQLNEGEQDMNTEQMINYHMNRAVELRAQEIVEARDREEPKWYCLVIGIVIGGVVMALLL